MEQVHKHAKPRICEWQPIQTAPTDVHPLPRNALNLLSAEGTVRRFHDLVREFFDEAPLAGIVAYALRFFQRRPERRLIPILPRHPINVFR